MSLAVKNGHGKKFIFRNTQDLNYVVDRLANLSSSLDLDYFYWFDSDSNTILVGYKDSENKIVSEKVFYKTFALREFDSELDLRNAYGIPNYFTDKKQIYSYGLLFKDSETGNGISEPFILNDSEGYKLYRKRKNTDGSLKEHYIIGGYWIIQPKLTSAKIFISNINQINTDFDIINWGGNNPFLEVEGTDLVTTELNRENILRGDFSGFNPAVSYVRGIDSENYELLSAGDTSVVNSTNFVNHSSNGIIYEGVRTSSDKLFFQVNKRIQLDEELTFHYITEFTDSEIHAKIDHDIERVVFERTLFEDDSEVIYDVISHPDNPPWKVFSDSDNDGFKAELGRQSGSIGFKKLDLINDEYYYLRRVIVQNTPATLDNSKPYDFDVEGYSIDSDAWHVLLSVRGSTAITNNVECNSTIGCSAFRVNVLQCQPGFDSEIDALEIKNISFITDKVKYSFVPREFGLFVTQPNTPYRFTTSKESLTVSGGLIGGGGGGGNSTTLACGGGGAGGGFIHLNRMVLKPYTSYEFFVGNHGEVNENGGDTYLKDLTNNVTILIAHGGGAGGVSNTTATGGTGGITTIQHDGHVIDYYARAGGDGGTYTALGNAENGSAGQDVYLAGYLSAASYRDYNNRNIIAGGGSGDIYSGNTGYTRENFGGGVSAGFGATPSGSAWYGQPNRGGGGGGCGKRDGNHRAGNRGGSGFAYLLFTQ